MGGYRLVRTESGSTSHGSGRRWSARRAGVVGVAAAVVGVTVVGVGIASGTTSSTPSVYSAITPVTVLGRSLAADSNTDVAVAGVGSVPSDATSVQLSVTALDGTTTSSVYVYPTGATKPTSANVRWQTGETVTIPVTVAVGASGDVRLTTDGGTVTVKVAVVGYFSPASAPGSAGYASYVNGPVSITTMPANIATVNVPGGSYEIQGKVVVNFTGSGSSADRVVCETYDPSGGSAMDVSAGYVSADLPLETVSIVSLGTTSGGVFRLVCYDGGASASASDVDLVAVQLSSATGAVASG